MAILLGNYMTPLLGVTIFIATLTYISYKLLSDYLHKWFVMKPIPELGRTYPIVGNALQFKPNAGEFFRQICEFTQEFQNEPLFKVWVGPLPFVVLYHAENVETLVTSSVHIDKSQSYDFLHPWLGTGLLTSTGRKWRQRRKMLTPTFHFSILTDFLEVMNEQAEILVERLATQAGKGPFNCFSYVTLCALDIICETAMGKKVYAQSNSESEYVKSVYKMSDIISRRQRRPWFWPNLIYNWFGDGQEQDRTLRVLQNFTAKHKCTEQKFQRREAKAQKSKEAPENSKAGPAEETAKDGTVWVQRQIEDFSTVQTTLTTQTLFANAGPTEIARRKVTSRLQSLLCLFDISMLLTIECTIHKACKTNPDWSTSVYELMAFIAVLFFRGATGGADAMRDCWSKYFGIAVIMSTMSGTDMHS